MESSALDELGKLYERAGKQVAGILPRGWQTAWCQVEMEEDHGSVNCFYVGADAPKPAYVRAPPELFNTFKAIWDGSPEPTWTTATFILHVGGKFDIDYGYDDISLDEVVERRAAWKRKYLPQ
jgi:Protein of unknown function, DUF600